MRFSGRLFVQQLHPAFAVTRSVGLTPLFSFNKELEQGDEMNIVMLIRNTRDCTIDEAITAAVQIHDDQVRQFERLSSAAAFIRRNHRC